MCTEVGRQLVKCECGFGACTVCTKIYFAGRPEPPACMSCRVKFRESFLLTHFSPSYVHKELEDARRVAVVQSDDAHQLATMEHVMPLVQAYEREFAEFFTLQARARETFVYFMLARNEGNRESRGRRYRDCRLDVDDMVAAFETSSRVSEKYAAAKAEFQACYQQLRGSHGRVYLAYNAIYYWNPRRDAAEQNTAGQRLAALRDTRLMKCTTGTCNGLFYVANGSCMVCAAQHCKECAAIDGPGHACERGAAATLKFVLTQTTSCPRCHANINRSSGCDQMMCTLCNCIFSFSTGIEERGVVHNPYFFHLAADVRRRVESDRAERGLTTRLLGEAPACNAEDDLDPQCVEFDSPVFADLLERAGLWNLALEPRTTLRDLYRHVIHTERVTISLLTDQRLEDRHGEAAARGSRIAFLRGATLGRIKSGAADESWLKIPALKPVPKNWSLLSAARAPTTSMSAVKRTKNLMRLHTARKKDELRREMETTYVAATKDLFRLLLVASRADRGDVLRQMGEIQHHRHEGLKAIERKPSKKKQ